MGLPLTVPLTVLYLPLTVPLTVLYGPTSELYGRLTRYICPTAAGTGGLTTLTLLITYPQGGWNGRLRDLL